MDYNNFRVASFHIYIKYLFYIISNANLIKKIYQNSL